jgi:ribonuclease P protein component
MSARASRSLKFTPDMRLRRGADFARIKARGERLVKGCLIANWLELSDDETSRLGVITSRRIGGSVVRSRARRLLRECFRLNQHRLNLPVDLVLIARRSIAEIKYAEVEADYLHVLQRANLLKPDE